MDQQLLDMLNKRFDRLDTTLDRMTATFKEHTDKDETYWKKLDAQEAQISLLKWMTRGLSGTAVIAFLYEKFGK